MSYRTDMKIRRPISEYFSTGHFLWLTAAGTAHAARFGVPASEAANTPTTILIAVFYAIAAVLGCYALRQFLRSYHQAPLSNVGTVWTLGFILVIGGAAMTIASSAPLYLCALVVFLTIQSRVVELARHRGELPCTRVSA